MEEEEMRCSTLKVEPEVPAMPSLVQIPPLGGPTTLQRKNNPKAQSEKKSPLKSQELRVAPGKLNNKINNRDLP